MADLSKYHEKADKALQKGRPEAALQVYLEALALAPDDSRVREKAAELYITIGQPSMAVDLLTSLLRDALFARDPQRAIPIFRKLLRSTRPSAQSAYEFAEFIEPTNKKEAIEAYEYASRQFQTEANPKESIRMMERVAALDPRPETYRRLGEVAAPSDAKTAAKAYVQSAVLQESAGLQAQGAYERAYQLDPQNAAAIFGHGRALIASGNHEQAVKLLEPLANYPSAPVEAREPYALALIGANRFLDAEPYLWDLFERNPQQHTPTIGKLIASLLDAGRTSKAVSVAQRLDDFQRKSGKRREFVQQMRDLAAMHPQNAEFMEFMAQLYDSCNREHDYCDTLAQLFHLYFSSANYIRAADALERAVDVDAYEPGHKERLAMLEGKVDAARVANIRSRLGAATSMEPQKPVAPNEPTVLEDLVLQAEIFLQYNMRQKAQEKVERIFNLFPHEEQTNPRVQLLYEKAGFFPRYSAEVATAPKSSTGASTGKADATLGSVAAPSGQTAQFAGQLARAGEVTRNLSRQSTPNGVLSTAVNELGRGWELLRCVAGLVTPGKPPSAALEYCAEGVKAADVQSLVKVVMGLQAVCLAKHGPFAAPDARHTPELLAVQEALAALSMDALLAIPMLEGDQQVGIIVLQHAAGREWKAADLALFQSIADHAVMAVNNARLRSLVKTLAVTDENSGLLKRASYLDVLLSEVQNSQKHHAPVSVALFHFGEPTALHREFGEEAVEQLVQQLGQSICSHIRQNDVAIRYGTTEVAVIFADTAEANAVRAVEKLRGVATAIKYPGTERAVQLTAGVIEVLREASYDAVDIVTEAVNRAEAAMALAKAKPGSTEVLPFTMAEAG